MSSGFQKCKFFNPEFIFHERRRSHRLGLILFGSLAAYLFTQHFVISTGMISEHSMEPTLQDNDLFLVNKYIYHFRKPHHGDIVVLRTTKYAQDQYVKRVIALEGDILKIHAGRVYLNGELLNEPYALNPTFPDFGPHTVPADNCFVMGDNRMHSVDSREFGSIPIKHLEGKIQPGEWFAWL